MPNAIIPPDTADLLAQIDQQLSQGIQALNDEIQKTGDAGKIDDLDEAVDALTLQRTQVIQAGFASDDAALAAATTGIKEQATKLEGISKKISAILGDAALAGKIVGYIAQAAGLIAKL